MKADHDGDCTIYDLSDNGRPEDGICTCGYGWEHVVKSGGDRSKMYSRELTSKIDERSSSGLEDKTG